MSQIQTSKRPTMLEIHLGWLRTKEFRLSLWHKLVQLFQSFCTIARLVPFLIQLYIQSNFQGGPEGWLLDLLASGIYSLL